MRRPRMAMGMAGGALWAAALAASAQSPEERERKRDEAIEALRKRIEQLESKAPAAPSPAPNSGEAPPAGPASGETPLRAYFRDGFRLKSDDGNFEAHIGGRVMEHVRLVNHRVDGGPQVPNTFTFKENYIQLDGTFYKEFEYKLQANFFPAGTNAGPFASLSDAYLGWKPSMDFGLRFGQMEVPFSQEEIASTLFIDFVERSVANRLSPVRDLGMMAYGAPFDGVLEYEAGIFNGTQFTAGNNTRNLNDNNDEKEFAARLRVTPFKASDSDWIRRLRLGVAATTGSGSTNPAAAANGEGLPPLSSLETGTTYGFYGATTFNDGDRDRLGLELSWLVGPFSLRAEYMRMRLDAVSGNSAPPVGVGIDGYYVAATYLLTGEDKPLENRIVPKHPFDPDNGDWGAFELAARVAALDAADVVESAHGLTDVTKIGDASGKPNGRILALTFGVNWWLTRNVRYSLNWVHDSFERTILAGANAHRLQNESAVLMRFQVDF